MLLLLFCVVLLFLPSCSHSIRYTSGKVVNNTSKELPTETDLTDEDTTSNEESDYVIHSTGKASYYGNKFNGRKTASGERFDNNKYTAAHKKLPFGTEIIVENVSNKKRVTVRINDRGPFTKNRILDVSLIAAKELDFVRQGTATIRIYIKKNK